MDRGPSQEPDRVLRVMRDGKSLDSNITDLEGGSRGEETTVQLGLELILQGCLRWPVAVDRDVEFSAEGFEALGMVAVLVRDDDTLETFGSAPDLCQALAYLP